MCSHINNKRLVIVKYLPFFTEWRCQFCLFLWWGPLGLVDLHSIGILFKLPKKFFTFLLAVFTSFLGTRTGSSFSQHLCLQPSVFCSLFLFIAGLFCWYFLCLATLLSEFHPLLGCMSFFTLFSSISLLYELSFSLFSSFFLPRLFTYILLLPLLSPWYPFEWTWLFLWKSTGGDIFLVSETRIPYDYLGITRIHYKSQ